MGKDIFTIDNEVDKKRRSLILGAFFGLVCENVKAKTQNFLDLPEIEPDFIKKTEEYQEMILSNLPEKQKNELLSLIKQILPDAYKYFINTPFESHLLRIGYYHLYIHYKLQIPSHSSNLSSITGKDIFFQTKTPFREPILLINKTFRVILPKNNKKALEPFDIISPENGAIVINGSYGVYEDELCREYTFDGKPTSRFLKINHGDFVEMLPIENSKEIDFGKTILPSDFRFPSSIVKDDMPQCSQVARELGQKLGRPFLQGKSALNSLSMYKKVPKYETFDSIPENYNIADVFMNSRKNPFFGHRAFAFRENGVWYVVDPYSHKDIVSSNNYRRKKDIIKIIVFT
ncbi:MAG: hypothetical protein PHH98_02825 [Candidatus Gracilibacteria bacterium]|nr:hypothetical protein [Candidatus Gracilibacteria bacterium]